MQQIDIDIAIIINSFNRFELLKESIHSLADWLPSSEFSNRCAVVVFEAGSTDGSIDWLQSAGQQQNIPVHIVLPQKGEDTSFSAGINSGVAYAKIKFQHLKYLLFYETDNQIHSAKPLSEALIQLKNRAELCACGFTVKKHSGAPAGIGTTFPTLLNFLLGQQIVGRFHLDKPPLNWKTEVENIKFSFVDVVYTSPLLIKLEAFDQSAGLDAVAFPFSDCDVDWAKRLHNLGWRMGIVEAEGVIHDNRETLSAWSKTRSIQFHRARLRYFKRFAPISVFIIWPLPLLLRHLFEWMVVKLFIKNKERRKQLSLQFSELIKKCSNKYE